MFKWTAILTVLLLFGIVCSAFGAAGNKSEPAAKAHFTLWQLPSQIKSIGMSYVLRTSGGKVIVFDGGWEKEAWYMREFLAKQGNKVDAWFITHPHDDHAGVLMDILRKPEGIKIERIYQSTLDEEWRAKAEPGSKAFSDSYYAAVQQSEVESVEVELGMVIMVDGVKFEVLGVRNPEILHNPYNNSSIVVKVTDSSKSVLFLGDLGVEAGRKLMAGPYASKLKSDYVQMAHHGQNGVDEDFYRAVDPKYCLWPMPKWLWDNNAGKGFDTGPWNTMKTKKWIRKLNVKKNYLSFAGLVKID